MASLLLDTWVYIDGLLWAQLGQALISLVVSVSSSRPLPEAFPTLIILADGALCFAPAYLLVLQALKKFSAHLVNTYIGATEPVTGIVLAYFILGEPLEKQVVYGLTIIAATIIARGLILYRKEKSGQLHSRD